MAPPVGERLAVVPVVTTRDIATARRRAKEVGDALGIDTAETAALAAAVSELARNALVHGGGGEVLFERIRATVS